jgi:hypothetical protein
VRLRVEAAHSFHTKMFSAAMGNKDDHDQVLAPLGGFLQALSFETVCWSQTIDDIDIEFGITQDHYYFIVTKLKGQMSFNKKIKGQKYMIN